MVRNASTAFNTRSNGGFTWAGIFRLTPGVNNYERLVDFSTTSTLPGTANGNFLICRVGNTEIVQTQIYGVNAGASNGLDSAQFGVTAYTNAPPLLGSSGPALSNVPQFAARAARSTDASYAFMAVTMRLNFTGATTAATWDVYLMGQHISRSLETLDAFPTSADRYMDRTYPAYDGVNFYQKLGRSSWGPDMSLSGDVSAFLLWDRPLGAGELDALHSAMLPRAAPARTFARMAGGSSYIQLPPTTTFASLEMWVRQRPREQQPANFLPNGAFYAPFLFDARNPSAPASLQVPAFIASGVQGTLASASTFIMDYDPVIDNGTVIQPAPTSPGGISRPYYLISYGEDRAYGDLPAQFGLTNGASLPSVAACAMQCNMYASCSVITTHTRARQDNEGSASFNCWSKAALNGVVGGGSLTQADMWGTAEIASGWKGLATLGAALYVDGVAMPWVRQSAFPYDNRWHHLVFTLNTALTDDLVLFARSHNGPYASTLGSGGGPTLFQKMGLACDVGEVRLYGTALTAGDAAARYAASAAKWLGAGGVVGVPPPPPPLPSFPLQTPSTTLSPAAAQEPLIWYNFASPATYRGGGAVTDSSPIALNATTGRVSGGMPRGARLGSGSATSSSAYLALAGGQNSGLNFPPAATPRIAALEFTLRQKARNAAAAFPPAPYPSLNLRVSKPNDGADYFNVIEGACAASGAVTAAPLVTCKVLNIGEVEAYSAPGGLLFGPPGPTLPSNRALRQPCTMSSQYPGAYSCDVAVDGALPNFAHTAATMDPAPSWSVQLKGLEPVASIVYTPRGGPCGTINCAMRSNNSLIELVLTANPGVSLWAVRLNGSNAVQVNQLAAANPPLQHTFAVSMPFTPMAAAVSGPALLDSEGGVATGPYIYDPRPGPLSASGAPPASRAWRPGFEGATLYVDGVSQGTAWNASALFRYDDAWHHYVLVPATPLNITTLRLFGRAVAASPISAWAQAGGDAPSGNYTSAGLAVDVLDVRVYGEPLSGAQAAARAASTAVTLLTQQSEAGDTSTVTAVRRFRYSCSSPPAFIPYTVPAGVSALRVRLWGAGGGAGLGNSFTWRSPGGAGAFVRGLLPVTPGTVFSLVLGRGGTQADTQAGGAGVMAGPTAGYWGGGALGARGAQQ